MAYKEEEFWNHAFQVHSQDEFVYCQIFFFILQWKYSISHIKPQGKAKGPSPDPTLGEETAVWSGVSECLYRGQPHFSPPVRTPRPAGTWTTYLLERSTARGLGGGMMRPTEGTSMSTPPGPVTYHLLRSLLSFRIHSSPLWTIFCKASSTVFWLDPQAYIFFLSFCSKNRSGHKDHMQSVSALKHLISPPFNLTLTQPNRTDALNTTGESTRCVWRELGGVTFQETARGVLQWSDKSFYKLKQKLTPWLSHTCEFLFHIVDFSVWASHLIHLLKFLNKNRKFLVSGPQKNNFLN